MYSDLAVAVITAEPDLWIGLRFPRQAKSLLHSSTEVTGQV